MTDILQLNSGYISPVGDYGRHNTQALGGVSHLWQDFFARALAEQQGEDGAATSVVAEQFDKVTGEPLGGAKVLAQIHNQRLCNVQDTELAPPEPLFLPIAEFEPELLEKLAPPFSAADLIEQQRQLDISNTWVRPVVMSQGHPLPEPGPAPLAKPLYLPIAEFDLDLLDKAAEPFDEATMAVQQSQLDFDNRWARPVVLNNVRVAA
ncbi:energy transducer TonB [Pseudomonas tructae]|uniref:Energy transducer TonB n=1 Tax=Pseudomonas tructae TaxID=2518644 RepID=A0A411MFQ5_9PSED|nr:energy transducer TonB [Pseudomonas tructae]QBF25509.1 energy transducer TonB [Pseudomonas tructae]